MGCTLALISWFHRFTFSQYDNRAEDLTKEGMREGIAQSAAFILFLSKVSGLPVNTVVLIAYNF